VNALLSEKKSGNDAPHQINVTEIRNQRSFPSQLSSFDSIIDWDLFGNHVIELKAPLEARKDSIGSIVEWKLMRSDIELESSLPFSLAQCLRR